MDACLSREVVINAGCLFVDDVEGTDRSGHYGLGIFELDPAILA